MAKDATFEDDELMDWDFFSPCPKRPSSEISVKLEYIGRSTPQTAAGRTASDGIQARTESDKMGLTHTEGA